MLEPEDFDIGRSLGGLSKTLEQAGKLEEALDFAQQCLAHRLEHEGKDSWWSNRQRFDTARILQKLSRNIEALSMLDELQASMGGQGEPDDDDRKLLADAKALRQALNQNT